MRSRASRRFSPISALFRSAPHPLKRLIYNRQHWFLAVLLEDWLDGGMRAARRDRGRPDPPRPRP